MIEIFYEVRRALGGGQVHDDGTGDTICPIKGSND